jgi:hypothetical protein
MADKSNSGQFDMCTIATICMLHTKLDNLINNNTNKVYFKIFVKAEKNVIYTIDYVEL